MRGEGSGGRMSERKRGQGALTITGFRSEIKTQWNMDVCANTLIRLTIETLRWNNPPLNQTIAESLSPIVIPTHDALYARHLQPTEASLLWLPIPLGLWLFTTSQLVFSITNTGVLQCDTYSLFIIYLFSVSVLPQTTHFIGFLKESKEVLKKWHLTELIFRERGSCVIYAVQSL